MSDPWQNNSFHPTCGAGIFLSEFTPVSAPQSGELGRSLNKINDPNA
jgi:hypothetical protein